MSRFYGTVRGGRGSASRQGHKSTGLTTYCASWRGAVRCDAYVNDDDVDCVQVTLTTWQGAGASPSIMLYDGPIDGSKLHSKGHHLSGSVDEFQARAEPFLRLTPHQVDE